MILKFEIFEFFNFFFFCSGAQKFMECFCVPEVALHPSNSFSIPLTYLTFLTLKNVKNVKKTLTKLLLTLLTLNKVEGFLFWARDFCAPLSTNKKGLQGSKGKVRLLFLSLSTVKQSPRQAEKKRKRCIIRTGLT